MDKTLIWLTVVKRKKASRPTVFQRSLSWIDSKALKEAEPGLRRLITLIFAGWLPHDYVSSWSCLYLSSWVRLEALSNSAFEGSPDRGCAPLDALETWVIDYTIFSLWFLLLFDNILYFHVVVEPWISLAMAHMNAQSSLAIAVTITCLGFPLAHSLL